VGEKAYNKPEKLSLTLPITNKIFLPETSNYLVPQLCKPCSFLPFVRWNLHNQSIVIQSKRCLNFRLLAQVLIKVKQLTSVNLRDKVAFNPFFLGSSVVSSGIKLALKAPGND
jgi:hypothetical protein